MSGLTPSIDLEALWKAGAVAIAGGVSLVTSAAVAVLGLSRFEEARQDARVGTAIVWGAVGALAAGLAIATIAAGLILIR